MNKHQIYKVPKCGAMDSKYFSNPDQFNKDVENKIKLHEEKRKCLVEFLDDFINKDSSQESNFEILVRVALEIKDKYKIK